METGLELAAIPWGEAVEGLAMRLSSPRGRHPAATEAELLVELRNVGEHSLAIGAFASEAGNGGISVAWLLRARVFDADGRPLQSSGPIIKSGAEPRLKPVGIAPDEILRPAPIPASSIEVEVDGKWIALNSRPGACSIQVIYELEQGRLEGAHWAGSVASNRLRLSFD